MIAGITQSSRLLEMGRLYSARTLTKSSPVHGIKNLVFWYESTLEESFDANIDSDSSTANKIANWYDVVSTSNIKNQAYSLMGYSECLFNTEWTPQRVRGDKLKDCPQNLSPRTRCGVHSVFIRINPLKNKSVKNNANQADEERQSIEAYLSKKWGIKLSS